MHNGSLKRIDKLKIGEQVLGEKGKINNVVGIEMLKLGSRKLYYFNNDKKYFFTPEHPFKPLRDGCP